MSHTLGDSERQPAKIYRDHMRGIPREMRVARRGYMVGGQGADGAYEVSCPGDEIGWAFFAPRTTEKQKMQKPLRSELTGPHARNIGGAPTPIEPLGGPGPLFRREHTASSQAIILYSTTVPKWTFSNAPAVPVSFIVNSSGFTGSRKSTPDQLWCVGRTGANTIQAFYYNGTSWAEHSPGLVGAASRGSRIFTFMNKAITNAPAFLMRNTSTSYGSLQYYTPATSTWAEIFHSFVSPANNTIPGVSFYSGTVYGRADRSSRFLGANITGVSDGIVFSIPVATVLSVVSTLTPPYSAGQVAYGAVTSSRGWTQFCVNYSATKGTVDRGVAIIKITGASACALDGPRVTGLGSTYDPFTQPITFVDYVYDRHYFIKIGTTGNEYDFLFSLNSNNTISQITQLEAISPRYSAFVTFDNRYIFVDRSTVGSFPVDIYDAQTRAWVPVGDYSPPGIDVITTQTPYGYIDTPL